MGAILNLGYGVFGTPLERCTFRLFLSSDDQGGRLSWTSAEYFHGGTFFEVEPATIKERAWDRRDVDSYYEQIEQHLLWGDAHAPKAQMVELMLKRGPIARVSQAQSRRWGWAAGTFLQETYYDFAPQRPGAYKWRYTYNDALVFGSSTVTGEVYIAS
jgi:hypothetical protein